MKSNSVNFNYSKNENVRINRPNFNRKTNVGKRNSDNLMNFYVVRKDMSKKRVRMMICKLQLVLCVKCYQL